MGQIINTYYFDASDAGPTDPDSAWTNDANIADGNTATTATTSSASFNYTTNELKVEGTNAPGTGDPISAVRYRFHNGTSYSSYFNIGVTPTGGWSWTVVQALEANAIRTIGGQIAVAIFTDGEAEQLAGNAFGSTSNSISKIELEVTSTSPNETVSAAVNNSTVTSPSSTVSGDSNVFPSVSQSTVVSPSISLITNNILSLDVESLSFTSLSLVVKANSLVSLDVDELLFTSPLAKAEGDVPVTFSSFVSPQVSTVSNNNLSLGIIDLVFQSLSALVSTTRIKDPNVWEAIGQVATNWKLPEVISTLWNGVTGLETAWNHDQINEQASVIYDNFFAYDVDFLTYDGYYITTNTDWQATANTETAWKEL